MSKGINGSSWLGLTALGYESLAGTDWKTGLRNSLQPNRIRRKASDAIVKFVNAPAVERA